MDLTDINNTEKDFYLGEGSFGRVIFRKIREK